MLTLSNLLSFSRVLLIVPFLYYLSFDTFEHNCIAFLTGLLTGLTDYLDGKLARRDDKVSTLGKYIDPTADKLFVAAAVIYFTFYRGNMPTWFGLMVVGKDALILLGGLVLLWKSIVVQADRPGKITVCAMGAVLTCYIFNLDELGKWATWAATLLVLHSTYFYIAKFVRLQRRAKPQ